jgi:hypothetical protein
MTKRWLTGAILIVAFSMTSRAFANERWVPIVTLCYDLSGGTEFPTSHEYTLSCQYDGQTIGSAVAYPPPQVSDLSQWPQDGQNYTTQQIDFRSTCIDKVRAVEGSDWPEEKIGSGCSAYTQVWVYPTATVDTRWIGFGDPLEKLVVTSPGKISLAIMSHPQQIECVCSAFVQAPD